MGDVVRVDMKNFYDEFLDFKVKITVYCGRLVQVLADKTTEPPQTDRRLIDHAIRLE